MRKPKMARMAWLAAAMAGAAACTTGPAAAQTVMTVEDPDGYSNMRSEAKPSAGVVAKVKVGERFFRETPDNAKPDWVAVTLLDGRTGFIHSSRVKKLLVTETPRMRFDIVSVTAMAAQAGRDLAPEPRARYLAAVAKALDKPGDSAALADAILPPGLNMGDSEAHSIMLWRLMHAAADGAFATAAEGLPPATATALAEALNGETGPYPVKKPLVYMRRHFPKTAATLPTVED